ncbi:MAG: hypothetical protein QNJ02_13720 [Desulfobacterales bacterium]|nr:hypothetical protein [Desulfobacterales bacterium]
MTHRPTQKKAELLAVVPEKIPEAITEADEALFDTITTTRLSEAQQQRITTPPRVWHQQASVLAIHWHPEFVPMSLIGRRIEAMYPDKRDALIIPTQHNVITSYGDYAGVEIDCYSRGFNQKVQLLLHFVRSRLEKANLLKSILTHTFKYRSSQLFDFMYTITKPVEARITAAARETGANDALVAFVRVHVQKISRLLETRGAALPPEMIKNKILRNFFEGLRDQYGDALIDRTQTYLKAVKLRVKAEFPLRYFYRTSEVIEEARALGAGIVIPHPEQFWPILLADYDVDGIEVWNPQSRKYTEFLISVINQKNRCGGLSKRNLLIFMGDDTHMAEKTLGPEVQDPEKASREIGYQPAWEDFSIRKALIRANTSRRKVIEEYKQRLGQ